MGWIILIAALMVVGIVLSVIGDKQGWYGWTEFLAGLVIFAFIALLIMGGTLINRGSKFNATIARYENTKALVETYDGSDYGNMNALTEQVISINNILAEHKVMSKSKWSGVWYSEEVGALEPITFARKPAVSENTGTE